MSFLATQVYTIPSLKNTESVRAEHFHFHLNFKNCSAVFDLEAEYNGVRCNGGKMWHSFFYLIILCVFYISPPPPPPPPGSL